MACRPWVSVPFDVTLLGAPRSKGKEDNPCYSLLSALNLMKSLLNKTLGDISSFFYMDHNGSAPPGEKQAQLYFFPYSVSKCECL